MTSLQNTRSGGDGHSSTVFPAPMVFPASAHNAVGREAVLSAMRVWLFFCLIIAVLGFWLRMDSGLVVLSAALAAVPACLAVFWGPRLDENSRRLWLIAAWTCFATLANAAAGRLDSPTTVLFILGPLIALAMADALLALDALIASVVGFVLTIAYCSGALRWIGLAPTNASEPVSSDAALASSVGPLRDPFLNLSDPSFAGLQILAALAGLIVAGMLISAIGQAYGRANSRSAHQSADKSAGAAPDIVPVAMPAIAARLRLGAAGEILQAEPRAAELLGRRLDTLWGVRLWMLVQGKEQLQLREAITRAVSSADPQIVTFRPAILSGAGAAPAQDTIQLMVRIMPVPGGGNLLVRPDLVAELATAPSSAQRSENPPMTRQIHPDTQFVAALSHELRNPLNAILGYVDLLKTGIPGKMTPKAASFLDRIQLSGTHMLGLIESALRWAKFDANPSTADLHSVPVLPATERALVIIRGLEGASERKIVVQAPKSLAVLGNAQSIQQILVNLVSNALKFSPAHSTIHVGWEGRAEHVILAVRNDSSELTDAQLEQLAKPFVQYVTQGASDQQRQRDLGAGLGLAITRQLAEQMSGKLNLRRAQNGGFQAEVHLKRADI